MQALPLEIGEFSGKEKLRIRRNAGEPSRFDTMLPSRRYGGPSPQMPALMRRADASA